MGFVLFPAAGYSSLLPSLESFNFSWRLAFLGFLTASELEPFSLRNPVGFLPCFFLEKKKKNSLKIYKVSPKTCTQSFLTKKNQNVMSDLDLQAFTTIAKFPCICNKAGLLSMQHALGSLCTFKLEP